MKKIFYLSITFMIVLFSFNLNIDALCYDDELNDWAIGAEVEFVDFDRSLINEQTGKPLELTMEYAYILTLKPSRDDVVMKATNNYNQSLEWMYIPGHKIWGIPNYIAKKTINYEITITGSEKSACPEEVLKKINYTVEPFNVYYKTEKCEYYPDAPLCEVYKDTSNITEDEFDKQMDEYIEEHKTEPEPTFLKKVLKFFLDYVIYILIPFIAIAVFYKIKINNIKKEERRK